MYGDLLKWQINFSSFLLQYSSHDTILFFIEQDIFDQIKEMHLNSTLHSVTVSLDFSREANVYQERNYEVPYTSWRIEKSGKEEEDSNHSEEFEGLLRKIDVVSKNQDLS